jgi:hypothetical protein
MRSTLEAGGADPETAPPERRWAGFQVPVVGWSSAWGVWGRWAFQRRMGWVVARGKVR